MKFVEIFSDGACSGNPGPGGWGAILRCDGYEKEISGGEAHTTNNRMEQILPWQNMVEVIEPFYPKAGNGRRPYPLETMLRIHCMQHWYNLSDGAMEDALYEIASMRLFARLHESKHENFTCNNSAGGEALPVTRGCLANVTDTSAGTALWSDNKRHAILQ